MKNILLSVIISLTAVVLNAQIQDRNPDGLQVIDRVIAQVGDNLILHSDIEMQKLQLMSENIPIFRDMDCRILEELLYQNLLLAQAKLDSLDIPDAQVDADMEQRLRSLESQIGGRDKLEQFYGKTYSQIKEEFRDVIKDRMLAEEMEREITRDVKVTPREVREFFKEIPEDSLPQMNEQVALQQIVIYPKITQRDKNEVIDQLNRWRNDILRGAKSFEAVATMHSQDPGSAKNGGRIEASRGMMVRPFEAAAFSLKIGEISEVVETQYGYHIIQLVDRRGDDYTVRHILRMPEVDRAAFSQAAALIDEAAKRLRDGEITWAKAVSEYSEDEMTKQNQGNIINPYTGELHWDVAQLQYIDRELFQLVARMQPGDISEPIMYQNMMNGKEGVRILRVREKIPPHKINLDDDYNFIKKAAEGRKKEEIIEKWVNEQSKRTFIKIDDKFSFCTYLYNW